MRFLTYPLFFLLSFSVAMGQTETSGRETYQASAEKHTELIHTKLAVSFNFDNQTLNGEEWLTASPFFYPTDSLILDAKSMIIHQVSLENKKGKSQKLAYKYEKDFLKIKLDKTYKKGEAYTIYIRYTAQPELISNKGSAAINDTKGLYFINPKGELANVPTQVWTQGETEYSSAWFPTIDKPNQKTTQEIFITVPEQFVTLSNGVLKSSSKNKNQRTDHWVMSQKHAPYLFFMGVGDFAVVKDTPWRKKVPIDYYVEKQYEAVAKKIFGHTAEMIEFFSKRFDYDFPWEKYAQMVVRDFVSGAMENTTAVSHSDQAHQNSEMLADENQWENVIAHEIAHHWFGNLVTTESWANLSVNEAFANYSEYLWIEHKYGKDTAEHHLANDIAQYHHNEDDFLKKVVRFGYDDKEDMFDLVSYNKGGAILHMLRDYLGDDAFFAGISDYLKTNAFGTGEVHQLRLSLEKVCGKDLNWFFNQWFFGNGNPIIKVQNEYQAGKNAVRVTIHQTQDKNILFEFPLEIDVYQAGKYNRYKVWVNAREENSFTFPCAKAPDLVNVNPRGVIVLKQESEYKSEKEYAFQYQNAKDYFSRNQAVEYASEYQYEHILLSACNDTFFRIREKALQGLERADLTEKQLSDIEKIAKNDPENLVKAAAITLLANAESQKYISVFEEGVKIHSAAVKNASLIGISKTNPQKVVQILKEADANSFSESQLTSLAPIIIENKLEKYLEKLMPNLVLYPFHQDILQKMALQKGFVWAMSLDNPRYVTLVEKALQLVKNHLQNPNIRSIVNDVLEEGIRAKSHLPSSPSITKQIEKLKHLQKGL